MFSLVMDKERGSHDLSLSFPSSHSLCEMKSEYPPDVAQLFVCFFFAYKKTKSEMKEKSRKGFGGGVDLFVEITTNMHNSYAPFRHLSRT